VSYSAEEDFGFTTLGGDTDEPELLAERILGTLRGALTEGLDSEAFSRTKNKLQGLMLRALDAPETVAHGALSACFRNVSPFVVLDLVETLDQEELLARLSEHVRDDAMASAIVRPRSQ